MKKILIVFILLVSVITFMLTRPKKINGPIVSESEIESYRQRLVGMKLYQTEKEIDKAVNEFKEMQTVIAKEKMKGMSFGEALKTASIISAGTLLAIYVIIQLSVGNMIEKHHLYRNENNMNRFDKRILYFLGWKHFK